MNAASPQLTQIEDHAARMILEEQNVSRRTKPLKIAMVAYSFYDWDNRVMRYADALAARGEQVGEREAARNLG